MAECNPEATTLRPRSSLVPEQKALPNPPSSVSDVAETLCLRAYQSLDELHELEPFWDNLVAEYPFASVFSTWEWLISWWQSFGEGRNLLVLAVFDSGSQLVGLAPMSISTERFRGPVTMRVLRLLGDGSEDSDNLDFPVRPGFEKALADRVLEYLQKNRHLWDLAQFNTMPTDSLVSQALIDSLKPPRWSCFEYSRNRLTVSLPPTWDEYLDQISQKERRNFLYYSRRLGKKYSVRISRCSSQTELPGLLEALFALHQLRWQQAGLPGSFASQPRRELYAELSRRLLARNWLELWFADLDGKIAAVQFAMLYGNTVYSLQEGYDPAHTADRIGFILRGEVLKQLISRGIATYDFLGGDDPHKARWKTQAGFYKDLHFAYSWTRGNILLNSAHTMLTAKEWLRARLHPSVWRVLHATNLSLRRRKTQTAAGES